MEHRGKIPYLRKAAEVGTGIELRTRIIIRAKHLLSSYYMLGTELYIINLSSLKRFGEGN